MASIRFHWYSARSIFGSLLSLAVLLSACNPLTSGTSTDPNFHPGAGGGGTVVLPVITPIAQSTYPLDGSSPPLIQGNSYALATASSSTGASVTLTCTYQSLGLSASDPNYATVGTNCAALSSISTANGTVVTGTLSVAGGNATWTPTYTQRGTFEFTFSATDGTNVAVPQTLIVTVRENDMITNLLAGLDALDSTNSSGLSASTASSPFASGSVAANWLDVLSSGPTGIASFTTATPWSGVGTAASPYGLQFNSANSDSMSLGNVLNASTKIGLEVWVKPGSPAAAGTAIASNTSGTATTNGFQLRQSINPTGRAEFVVGQKYYSYRDLILSDKPTGYWRLDESSGTTANDLTSYGDNGTYTNVALSASGALNSDADTAISVSATAGENVNMGNVSPLNFGTANFSAELWMKLTALPPAGYTYLMGKRQVCLYSNFWNIMYASGKIQYEVDNGTGGASDYSAALGATTVSDGLWHHVVLTRSGGTTVLYVDGVQDATVTVATTANITNAGSFQLFGSPCGGGSPFSGSLDEVSVYNYTLSPQQVQNHYNTGHSGPTAVAYPGNAILADKPSGYWRLGEKSGTTAYDLSGNGNNGTYTGGVTLGQTGVAVNDSDNAAKFDGSTGFVMVPQNATLEPTSGTVCAWLKATSFGALNSIVAKPYNGPPWSNPWVSYILRIEGGGATLNGVATAFSAGTWYHICEVTNSVSSVLYKNGAVVSSTAGGPLAYGTNMPLLIGADYGNTPAGEFFNGVIDEVAVFNYALSPTQIANQYNSGNGPSWWYCQSQTQLNSSNWNLLSGLWDGTKNTLLVNGQQECQVTPGATYSGAVANTSLGQSGGSSYWQGLVSMFKLFGSSSSTPLSAANAQTDFSAEANRFRSVPRENTVSSGLLLDLDPANAAAGTAAYSSGCASTSLSWFDHSPSSNNGALTSFTACGASSGWNGTGTVASPYLLSLNGTTNWVNLGSASTLEPTGAMTVAAWVNAPGAGQGSSPQIVANGDATGVTGYNLYYVNSTGQGAPSFIVKEGANAWGNCWAQSTTNYLDGKWHYIVGVYTGTNISIYVDGNTPTTTACQNAAVNYGASPGGAIGQKASAGFFKGSVGPVQMYGRALLQQEIKQNCLAEQGRFTSSANICAAP